MKGTPLYMAPELIREEAVADPKIDIWSLGIILYRMLYSGNYPFLIPGKKYNRETAFMDIIGNDLIIPKTPKRSTELTDLLKIMLQKNPSNRIGWEELFLHPLLNLVDE